MQDRHPFRFAALLSFPLAAVVAASSLGGIALPGTYASESATWAAQGIGQDWVDLLLVAPWLAVCAAFTLRGSRVFALLLGGTLAYVLYSMVLYAFMVHFNALFLAYSAGLGLSFFALVSLVCAFEGADVRSWFDQRAPARGVGLYSVCLGAAFYLLWLLDIIPALAAGDAPASVAAAGLVTNPVEVLDIGIALPAFVVGGVSLMRRRRLGYWLVPLVMMFGVVMNVALIGMTISMAVHRAPGGGPPVAVFGALIVAGAGALWWLLRGLRSS
jgi:hypothetical protein